MIYGQRVPLFMLLATLNATFRTIDRYGVDFLLSNLRNFTEWDPRIDNQAAFLIIVDVIDNGRTVVDPLCFPVVDAVAPRA